MPEALKKLIHNLNFLPWIWEKAATKLAFFLLNSNQNYLNELEKSIINIKNNTSFCKECYSITDKTKSKCNICNDDSRNKNEIMVVEEYLDMLTIEQAWWYLWLYHILWWAISPINWVFVWDLKFQELFDRIRKADKKLEIILATNPNIEWEATCSYFVEEIKKIWLKHKVKITRLSRWLSSWYIEYADNITLVNSLKERKEI